MQIKNFGRNFAKNLIDFSDKQSYYILRCKPAESKIFVEISSIE